MEFTYPANLRFECNGCGLCCGDTKKKTRHILLLGAEAESIAFCSRRRKEDFCVAINDKNPYEYEMKKSSNGHCSFLKNNRCSIYSMRPLVCMFYPFELKFDESKSLYNFDFTVECPAMGKGIELGKDEFKKLFDKAQEKLR